MRKIICLLLALVTCCMLATAVSAATTVPTTCAAGCENPTWVPLPSGNLNTLAQGHYHYYLTGNDTKYRYTPNPTNGGAKVTICLDLNGYNITTDGRAFGVYQGCTLNIMDSSAEKTGYIKSTSGNNATVGGTMFVYGTANLYSGVLQYENDGTGTNQAYAGGVIGVGNSTNTQGVFNMYGGRLEGGAMVSNTYAKGATLCAEYGTVNLYGGEIVSGSVPEGRVGPCVYIGNTAQLTLSGSANVDNIYVGGSNAKVNISGTYSGKARLTLSGTPTNGKVIGTATNTPSLTGDLFCTNGSGWLVKVSGSNLALATYTPSGEWHYCEHCREVRRWTDYNSSNFMTPNTTVGTYHYYLSQDRTATAGKYPQLKNGSVVCLDMYGHSLTCPGRALLVNGGCTLSVMDTKGGGFIAGGPGTNNPRGGTATVSGTATMNMYSGTLKYIPGTGDAKNGMLAIGGVLNLYGGRIEGADMSNQSASVGGAVYLYNSNGVDGVLNAYGGEITAGKVGSVGACVYAYSAKGSVNLSGDARVENIYFPVNNKLLSVSGDYTGTASVTFATAPALGAQVGTAADNARILGTLSLTNGDRMIQVDGTKLITAISAPVVVVDGEKETGYMTLQEAIDACESGYVKLLKPLDENVTVSKEITLDLNGYAITGTVTAADGATLYVKDAQTDDYTVADGIYGTLTASGNVCAQEGYMAVTEGDKLSFHRITVQITDMTLRPSAAGIYYKCSFLGDEKVAALVESFGVALSVYEVPNAANLQSVCGYTTYTGFQAGVDGNATTSTLLKGILKEDNSQQINTENLNMLIYGRPYIKTASGYIFGQVRCRSLSDQLERIDSGFEALNVSQRNAVLTMYETFRTTLEAIELPNIIEEKIMNEETLSILMVGNSFCYYYVEELYGLLMANPDADRGYKNVEIYNLYYSGCKLNQHYDWWRSGAANYDLYKTDASGRKKQTPASGTKWTLEDTLQLGRWDYLSLQGASGELDYVSGSVAANCASIVQYAEPLLDRFHQLHPYAQLLWHRTWPFEVGRKSGSITYTEESLAAYDAGMQAACDYMCNEFDQDKPYDLMMVNSGAAWTVARQENAKLAVSLIPEGGLCARKGVRNETTFPYYTGNANAGDGYHDGDIGGGQFLNACVWYETLTGQSVLENSYRPTLENGNYALSDALAELLRNAAHSVLNP